MSKLVILIHAPYLDDYGPMRKAAGTYFPLGLGYVAASLKAAGYDAALLDPNVQDLAPDEIARRVADAQPALVGISFMTPQFRSAARLCEAIRQAAPAVPIALGGAHPSVLPARTLREIPQADYAVVCEGEQTVVELLAALEEGASPGAVAGLAWRDGEHVRLTPARRPIADLDALPLPDRSLIDQGLYRAQSFLSYSPRTGAIHTARGCPGRCVFCCSGHRLRSTVRERSIDSVMAEIDVLRRDFGMEYLLIKDDTFTLRRSRTMAFCEAMRRRHPGLRWHCMGRVNTVDESLLRTMRDAGLHDIFFGIESGNDEILRRCGKGITTARARQSVEACAKLGIRTYGAFILGLPGETPASAEQTVAFACSLPLTMAGFSILIPYPGTKAFEDYYEPGPDGAIAYEDFIASTGLHFAEGYTGLRGLGGDDLIRLVAAAQRRFYLRPVQILRMLRHATGSMVWGYVRGLGALVSKEATRSRGRRKARCASS